MASRWRAVATAMAVVLPLGCDRGADTVAEPAVTGAPEAAEPNAIVDRHVDGDTIDVEIAGRVERVRLIGIDTPELARPDTDGECFGPEASSFVADLLPVGTPVRIVRDTVNRDDYGRLLGYVYRGDDGVFVNYELVRHGYATPLSIRPNTTHAELFVDAARSAERDDAGLWAACGG